MAGPNKQRNVMVDDSLWGRIRELAARNRRPLASETRVALEVYAVLAERRDPIIEEVLNGSGR